MNIVLAGGAGTLGSEIAGRLSDDGHKVIVLDPLFTSKREDVPDKCTFQLRDMEDVFKTFRHHPVDLVVVSVAGLTDYYDSKSHCHGVIKLLSSMVEFKVPRIVFISDKDVYGNSEFLPFTEESEIRPTTIRGFSRAYAESMCQIYGNRHGVSYTILRVASVYGGKRDEYSLVRQFLDSVDGVIKVPYSDSTQDLIHTYDVASAVSHVISENLTGIYNVSSGEELPNGELAETVKEEMGSNFTIKNVCTGNVPALRRCVMDNSKLVSTGWAPLTELRCGIREMMR